MSPILLVLFTWFGWVLAGAVRMGFIESEEERFRKIDHLAGVTFFAGSLAVVLWLRGAA